MNNRKKHKDSVDKFKNKSVKSTGGGFLGPDSLIIEESRKMIPQIVEDRNKITTKYGTIDKVLPTNNKVYVTVREIPLDRDGDEQGDYAFSPPLFNAFGKPETELSIMQVMIPLLNIDLSTTSIQLENLLDKFVAVHVDYKGIAKDCELISSLPNDDYFIGKPLNLILKAAQSNIEVEDLFIAGGYSPEQVKKMFEIKVDDFEHQPGRIFRIKGEAYWDRDTGKLKEQDINIPEEKNFYDDWASKNLKKKMQCHYPVTLFGAK